MYQHQLPQSLQAAVFKLDMAVYSVVGATAFVSLTDYGNNKATHTAKRMNAFNYLAWLSVGYKQYIAFIGLLMNYR